MTLNKNSKMYDFVKKEFKIRKPYSGKDIAIDSIKCHEAFESCDMELVKNTIEEILDECFDKSKYTWNYTYGGPEYEDRYCVHHFTIEKKKI